MNGFINIIKLAFIFLKIGVISFGGGWTIVGIMQTELVPIWISLADFQKLIPVAQATPGPIALNAATLIGLKYYGIPGAVITSISVLLPPLLIVILFSLLSKRITIRKQTLDEALRTASIALLMFTVWSLAPHDLAIVPVIFAACAFLITFFSRINPAWVIAAAGLVYALFPL